MAAAEGLAFESVCTLPQLAKLQPLRLLATFGTHVALAVHGGQCLYTLDVGSGREASALSHHGQPICALTFVERRRELFMVALQEDAGVAVWLWAGTPSQRAWRLLLGCSLQPQLRLPPAAGHRGCVRAACACAVSEDVCLLWLLQRPESSLTELLLRRLPVGGASDSSAAPVERLGRLGDAHQLFCAGGCEAWVLAGSSATLAAHRWCLHTRVCLARVRLVPGASATLHGVSRELLVRSLCGKVVALSPPLRTASLPARLVAGASVCAVTSRVVGHLRSALPCSMLASDGVLVFVMERGSLVAHHLPSGVRVNSAQCPLGACLQHDHGSSGGVVVWHAGDAGISVWRCSARAPSTVAALLVRAHDACALVAVSDDSKAWGGSLGAADAGATLWLESQAQQRVDDAFGSSVRESETWQRDSSHAGKLCSALRSFASLLPILHRQACQRPLGAQHWVQTCESLDALCSGASQSVGAAASSFHSFTPLAVVSGRAWSVAGALDSCSERTAHAPALGWECWKKSIPALVAAALNQCKLERDTSAEDTVQLFGRLTACEAALCAGAFSRCSWCASVLSLHLKAGETLAAPMAARLATCFARTVASKGLSEQLMETAMLGLFYTLPSALSLFVQAAARESGLAVYILAQLALRIIPPAGTHVSPGTGCVTLGSGRRAAQAELLCMAGHHASGMWLVLHGSQPDWAAAVRLVERECGAGGGSSTRAQSLAVAPLMLEVLAEKVCVMLAAIDDALDGETESESLAACVAHLFLAAKSVGALIRSVEAPLQTGTWKSGEPSLIDALQGVLDACAQQEPIL